MEKYFDNWSSRDDLMKDFETSPTDFPTDEEILFACYSPGDYYGSAIVVYEHDGKLFEVNGSHCSCCGLEGQWSPEETSAEALGLRSAGCYDISKEAEEAFRSLWPHNPLRP